MSQQAVEKTKEKLEAIVHRIIYNRRNNFSDAETNIAKYNESVEQLLSLIDEEKVATLQALINRYAEVQRNIDYEYGKGVHKPNYYGIILDEIEKLKALVTNLEEK